MTPRHAVAAAAIALALLAAPAVAAAAEGSPAVVVDRADFYEPAPEEGAAARLLSARSGLVQISDEMKYFTKYESHGDYDLGFSPGDGYNAVGYYQFDRRYSLISFMRYCKAYDAGKYAVFDAVIAREAEVADGAVPMYEDGAPTEVGALVEAAWHAAYAADPSEFSLLQDNFAYDSYYALSESYLASRGVSMAGRADCVKGLVWSMTNLFGSGGVRWFLDEAGLSDGLTDREFVNRLVDAVVDNVAERYPSQPQYHEGWIGRYEAERADCLAMLPEDAPAEGFSDVPEGEWYSDAVAWVVERGYMSGYGDGSGTFGPTRPITRAEMVTVLWNRAGRPAAAAGALPPDCGAQDYYAGALLWALGEGVVTGYVDGTFHPAEGLTREQAATMLWRACGSPEASGDLSAYPDAGQVTEFAAPAMRWAVSTGVITGRDGSRLEPQGTCSRAELAVILTRL